MDTLGLGKFVPVAHDSSGFAAVNFALAHPERVDFLCMLDSAYGEAPTAQWPEMVELFANKRLAPLAGAIAQNPEPFAWILNWQKQQFLDALRDSQKAHFEEFLGPLIADNYPN